MDKEIMKMIDTLTQSLDLIVNTQRKTQEFMKEQLTVNKALIQRIKKLEVEANVVKTNEGAGVNDIFQNMVDRFNKERDDELKK